MTRPAYAYSRRIRCCQVLRRGTLLAPLRHHIHELHSVIMLTASSSMLKGSGMRGGGGSSSAPTICPHR
jgi:hypothetical protein